MKQVRVIALGSEDASDDGAAIAAVRRLRADPDTEIVIAGRPGVGLLDLLDPAVPTVLTDVVAGAGEAGYIHEVPLAALLERALALDPVSSHGLGPVEALRLGRALGRALPPGIFVGIAGARFEPGHSRSKEVERAIDDAVDAIAAAIEALRA